MAISKLKDVATQTARGWVAGLAGMPGDLEGLARMVIKYGATPGSYVDRNMSETPALPTSEFYNQWLPGGDWETPEGGLAQDLATAVGGLGVGKLTKPLAGAAQLAKKYGVQAAEAAARNASAPAKISKHAGFIKLPGGNWLSGSVEDSMKGLKRPSHRQIDEIVSETELYGKGDIVKAKHLGACPTGYADGGLVQYDSDRIDRMVAELQADFA